MGTDNLNKRRSQERKKRKSKALSLRAETWLIVCEGTKTEVGYFNSLLNYINSKVNNKINFIIKGTGKNTTSLVADVDELMSYSDELVLSAKIPYGKVFVVFDKDDFSDNAFNSAIKRCEKQGYIPLWSNECFELWYILHYEYLESNILRSDYTKKLSKLLCNKYNKNGNHFEQLDGINKLPIAIKNAKRLFNKYNSNLTPAKKIPCTMIFKFIEEIESYIGFKIQEIINKNKESIYV